MDKLFLQIINMSITSSYIILIILAIRLFLKKAPKIFSYALWLIPFIRLIIPFSFESVFSLVSINTRTIPEDIIYTQRPQIESGIRAVDNTVNRVLPGAAVEASVNPMQIWITIGTVIWIIGIMILLVYSVYSTSRLSNNLKSATLLNDNIYEIETIKTPFVFGLFKPKIYLPNNLSENENSYIIKHEQTHIKRLDHISKFLAFIIASIHWFNPLVWLGYHLMSEDMELSCDESVIKEMGYEIKKDYSNSLLSLSTGKRIIGGSPVAFGESNTKGRIKNILNYKRPKFWVIIVAVIILVAVCVGLLTDPVNKSVIMVNDILYQQSDERINKLPSDAYEIGELKSILHNKNEVPEHNFQGAMLDEKYAGNLLYQSRNQDDVLYLEDLSGYYIIFIRIDDSLSLSDRRPMILVNGDLYLDTGREMAVEIDESAIIGEITSSVSQSEEPSEEGQSNFGNIGAKYAYFEDNIVVLINNEWVLFEKDIETRNEDMTVEDYAWEYIDSEIEMYGSDEFGYGFKVIDKKMTKLEKVSSFGNILSSPVELWRLEYRLKPENIDEVMIAGGMQVEDGWLTEDSSMGKPELVFTYEGDNLVYLGNLTSQDIFGLDSLASQEIAIRQMLEDNGILPYETFEGNHVVIKFTLSTGETAQLLLSQPVKQGDHGIWVIERWMDGNGYIYHNLPAYEDDIKIDEYYRNLQDEVDNGHKPWMLDPVQVGYDYIFNSLGQTLVKMNDLEIIVPSTIEDFLMTPESHYIGYITMMSSDERLFHFDKVEWLSQEDEERAAELGIDTNLDMPSGFMIYNPATYPDAFDVSDETEYLILETDELGVSSGHKSVTKEELIEYNNRLNNNPLFHIYTKDGYVTRIIEQYVP